MPQYKTLLESEDDSHLLTAFYSAALALSE